MKKALQQCRSTTSPEERNNCAILLVLQFKRIHLQQENNEKQGERNTGPFLSVQNKNTLFDSRGLIHRSSSLLNCKLRPKKIKWTMKMIKNLNLHTCTSKCVSSMDNTTKLHSGPCMDVKYSDDLTKYFVWGSVRGKQNLILLTKSVKWFSVLCTFHQITSTRYHGVRVCH